jgi:hypothetical protein
MQLDHLAPDDLRRTCAELCHVNGGEIAQIQFLLGHASLLTTERISDASRILSRPARTVFYLLKAFSRPFWNNETHVFMEYLRTFGTFPKGQADRKKVPLLIRAVDNCTSGHCNRIFHRTFKNAA